MLINLAISLFSVLKVNTFECLSLINQKCMTRPKILNINEGIPKLYLKINKRESRVGIDIYYIGYILYKLEYITNRVVPLYLNVKSLLGSVEKINGSSDRYLVIDKSNVEVINVFNAIKEYMQSIIIKDNLIKIDGFDKIRFSSDIDLPLGKLIEFKVLTIITKCIIKKNDKYYPEIYLD